MNALEESKKEVFNAIQNLLGVCDGASTQDGAGFNGWDARFVRDVMNQPVTSWSPKLVEALRKMLKKYRGQLETMGIDWAKIPFVDLSALTIPTMPGQMGAAPKSLRIDRVGEKIALTFPYNPALVVAVRDIPGREWDGGNKRWILPLTSSAIEALGKFLEIATKSLSLEDGAGILAELNSIKEEAEAMQSASMAAEADFHVEGLGGELRPFQRAGVAYASKAKRCFIADEMGLGKTVQALATVHHLNAYPVLVVCPASLKINWLRESNKWLKGHPSQVLPSWYKADVDVTNYESLPKLKQQIKERKYKSVIVDECHYVKNHKAIRTKALVEIVEGIEVRLLLSGTPIVNRPAELLAQLGVLGRLEDLGGFRRFSTRYLQWDFKGYGTNLDELQRELRAKCFIRRKKSDVLKELPPKIRTVVDMELEDKVAYENAANEAENEIGAIQLFRHEAARQKLRDVEAWVRDFLETGEKLVLFAVHIDIQKALILKFPGCATILGEETVGARQASVDRFQTDKECQLIVCSLKAAGVGLTLTAASNVAFVEQDWTPGGMEQAEDRCHRIGQLDSVTAWYLLAKGTIDTEMSELIEEKRKAISSATDSEKSKIDPSVFSKLAQKYKGRFGKEA